MNLKLLLEKVKITYENLISVYDAFVNIYKKPIGNEDMEQIFSLIVQILNNLKNYYKFEQKKEIVKYLLTC